MTKQDIIEMHYNHSAEKVAIVDSIIRALKGGQYSPEGFECFLWNMLGKYEGETLRWQDDLDEVCKECEGTGILQKQVTSHDINGDLDIDYQDVQCECEFND